MHRLDRSLRKEYVHILHTLIGFYPKYRTISYLSLKPLLVSIHLSPLDSNDLPGTANYYDQSWSLADTETCSMDNWPPCRVTIGSRGRKLALRINISWSWQMDHPILVEGDSSFSYPPISQSQQLDGGRAHLHMYCNCRWRYYSTCVSGQMREGDRGGKKTHLGIIVHMWRCQGRKLGRSTETKKLNAYTTIFVGVGGIW